MEPISKPNEKRPRRSVAFVNLVLPSPVPEVLGLPHLRAWSTLIYRVTGLRAVEVNGECLTDSRGSHPLGLCAPLAHCNYYTLLVCGCQAFFQKNFLKKWEPLILGAPRASTCGIGALAHLYRLCWGPSLLDWSSGGRECDLLSL